jgi:hypothetical protein
MHIVHLYLYQGKSCIDLEVLMQFLPNFGSPGEKIDEEQPYWLLCARCNKILYILSKLSTALCVGQFSVSNANILSP